MKLDGLVFPITLKQTMLKNEHNKSVTVHLSNGILTLAKMLKRTFAIKCSTRDALNNVPR